MTEVRTAGFTRGWPLALEPQVFDLIAGDRDDLRTRDGKPSLIRIAELAGVNKQRLFETAKAIENGDNLSTAHTMGSLARAYSLVHNVDEKAALAAILRIATPAAEPGMERAA